MPNQKIYVVEFENGKLMFDVFEDRAVISLSMGAHGTSLEVTDSEFCELLDIVEKMAHDNE